MLKLVLTLVLCYTGNRESSKHIPVLSLKRTTLQGIFLKMYKIRVVENLQCEIFWMPPELDETESAITKIPYLILHLKNLKHLSSCGCEEIIRSKCNLPDGTIPGDIGSLVSLEG
ncbi:hypothetical protein TorRG33x02_124640 [Trema orientale]|uniref:Uncharacterized protein n=1 Tax=Trema orientale TaxID=63057 RepID=A0A2P5F245_TREOI|nr:hypothetical protein TorRG33x02_124640 [Trema orientale]